MPILLLHRNAKDLGSHLFLENIFKVNWFPMQFTNAGS